MILRNRIRVESECDREWFQCDRANSSGKGLLADRIRAGKRFSQSSRQLRVIGLPDSLANLQAVEINGSMLKLQFHKTTADRIVLSSPLLQDTKNPSTLLVMNFAISLKHNSVATFDGTIKLYLNRIHKNTSDCPEKHSSLC